MSWFSNIRNKVQQTSKDLGVTDKLNQASAAWNEFWDKPMTIQYAHNPYEVVANKGPQEVTQRRGDVVKQVALASSVPAIAAGVVTAGVPATISGFTIGTATGAAGSYGGKKAAQFIGLDKNAQELAGNIVGTLTGLYGGTGATNVMANRNRIAYNNTVPFCYDFKNNLNFKGLIKDTGKAFLNPFKQVKVVDPLKKRGNYFTSLLTDDAILSRDAAFRKALNIELTPQQKGLYYDRPDGTVGINYKHPLAQDRSKATEQTFEDITGKYDNLYRMMGMERKGYRDYYTKGTNGGNIGVKDFVYNPESNIATFTTFDTWDLQPFQGVKWLPNKIRNIEFVNLLGGKPFTWVDKQVYYPIASHKSGGGIHIKPENRGKFTEYCGGKVTDECIQRAKRSGNKKLIKRAVFAQNSRSWSKKHFLGGQLI